MLDALKFVQGAVAKKDFVPELTHFYIGEGMIKGYNGRMALCSPLDIDLEILPRAVPFAKAVATCRDTVQLNLTPNGRLAIKSGKFKAFVDCLESSVYPDVAPEGEKVTLEGGLLPTLKKLAPFIAEDASRSWARGILLRGASAFATNNIILVECWLGHTFPSEVNIPKDAVAEILRIGQEPDHLLIAEDSVTFVYGENRWLRTQLFNTGWPDLSAVLDRPSNPPKDLPNGFNEALTDLLPFVDDLERVYLSPDELSTHNAEDLGAHVGLPGLIGKGLFNIKQLNALLKIATQIDFDMYPAPCLFFGEGVRGAITGMRG